jgi:hypothetical protein
MSIIGERPDAADAETASKEFRLRPATKADIPAIVALLGEAFQDGDPISEWIFPDERQRRVRQPRMLRELVRHRHLPVGDAEVAVSVDRVVGVSLFRRSWRKPTLARRIVGDLALLRAMGLKVRAGAAVDAALEGAAPAGPHITLVHLACEPAWARAGVGTALFMSLFAKSVEVKGAFYGVMKPENFTFYTSILVGLGVLDESVAGEVSIGRDGPTMNTLWGHPHY